METAVTVGACISVDPLFGRRLLLGVSVNRESTVLLLLLCMHSLSVLIMLPIIARGGGEPGSRLRLLYIHAWKFITVTQHSYTDLATINHIITQ